MNKIETLNTSNGVVFMVGSKYVVEHPWSGAFGNRGKELKLTSQIENATIFREGTTELKLDNYHFHFPFEKDHMKTYSTPVNVQVEVKQVITVLS